MAAINNNPRTCWTESVIFSKHINASLLSLKDSQNMIRFKVLTRVQLHTLLFLSLLIMSKSENSGLFRRVSWLDEISQNEPLQRNYGVAAADVDLDGSIEWIVAGFTGPNYVLKYNTEQNILENIAKTNLSLSPLLDPDGRAIGVCACDIDGDGREEIYFLNTNNAFAGKSSYGDKLFKYRNGKYINLFDDEINRNVDAKNYAGRSVACVDRFGSGKYAIAIATYSDSGTGKFALLEMDESHPSNDVNSRFIVIRNVAKDAFIAKSTGGRGITVEPLVNDEGKSDIFFDNEGNNILKNSGNNFLFKNLGNGSFVDVAREVDLQDVGQNGRGVALADINHDGLLDVVCGNWLGPHRVYTQERRKGKRKFKNVATAELAEPSPVRTVIVADFDNDGFSEIFFNNIYSRKDAQPNKLFKVQPRTNADPVITKMDPGDAVEEEGCGTGGGVADIDGDGRLELLLSHGEDSAQPLKVYKVAETSNDWIRISPKTKFGAPARGATVSIETERGDRQMAVIDGGSGYLCQMEPVAHFGLGKDKVVSLQVVWPDSRKVKIDLTDRSINQLHVIEHPDYVSTMSDTASLPPKDKQINVTLSKTMAHEEL